MSRDERAPLPSSAASDPQARRLRILVVEDDVMALDILTRWLRRRDYLDVRGFADGQAGLAACLQAPPDLLILDHQVPGLTGLAIAEQLHINLPRVQRPWTVLFTAACNASVLHLMSTGNFDDLLHKPSVGALYARMLLRAHDGLRERRIDG